MRLTRINRPFATDQARSDTSPVLDRRGSCFSNVASVWQGYDVCQRPAFEFPQFSFLSDGARAVHSSHLQDRFWRHVFVLRGKCLHLIEHAEFDGLPRFLANRGQAVCSEADVHAGALQRGKGEFSVRKEIMTARAMHNARTFLRKQSSIPAFQVVGMDRHQVGAECVMAGK